MSNYVDEDQHITAKTRRRHTTLEK